MRFLCTSDAPVSMALSEDDDFSICYFYMLLKCIDSVIQYVCLVIITSLSVVIFPLIIHVNVDKLH